jgi:hypothetical protein
MPQQIKNSYVPSLPLMGICPKELKSKFWRDPMYIANIIHDSLQVHFKNSLF